MPKVADGFAHQHIATHAAKKYVQHEIQESPSTDSIKSAIRRTANYKANLSQSKLIHFKFAGG